MVRTFASKPNFKRLVADKAITKRSENSEEAAKDWGCELADERTDEKIKRLTTTKNGARWC